jgi:hypothetical protein
MDEHRPKVRDISETAAKAASAVAANAKAALEQSNATRMSRNARRETCPLG